MKILILLESGAKISTIDKITTTLVKKGKIKNNKYLFGASVGHIRRTSPKCLSIDIKDNYKPIYEIDPNKKSVVSNLKRMIKSVDIVYLAMDNDREGEGIAVSLVEELKIKNYKRIIFNEITEYGLEIAINNPCDINYNIYNSYQARTVADKIVGYGVSRCVWFMGSGLSAGRVQSVVVRLIIDRENEINDFSENSFYEINATFKKYTFTSTLNKIKKVQKKKYIGEINKIKDIKLIKEYLELFKSCKYFVKFIFSKKGKRNPSPPFITSSMQQEAYNKLNFAPKRTMDAAQKLYEAGLITYMRTDSTNVSKEKKEKAKKYIEAEYGEEFYCSRSYNKKSKNAQEAHEAIVPIDINKIEIKKSPDEIKLYKLIRNRFLASQMASAEIDTTFIQIDCIKDNYFEYSFEKIIFLGFLIVYDTEIKKEPKIPEIKEELTYNEINIIQKFTKSIGRYNEASIIKKLEELGIGRPSTFAAILKKIIDRNYVEKKNMDGEKRKIKNFKLKNNEVSEKTIEKIIGGEKNKLIPTEIGIKLVLFLIENFTDIMDYNFTAKIEEQLDDIVNEKVIWYEMIDELYKNILNCTSKIEKKVNNSSYTLIGKIKEKEIWYGKDKFKNNSIKCIDGEDIKYIVIPDNLKDIDLKLAKKLIKFPYSLGEYDDKNIDINMGRYGLYLQYDKKSYSIEKELKLYDAIELIKIKKEIKIIKDKNTIYYIKNGPYGPYISYKKGSKYINKKITKKYIPEKLTLKEIKEIVK